MLPFAISRCAPGLLLFSSVLFGATVLPPQDRQELTPAPRGPFHVTGNRILDAAGHPFLIRGTQLAEFRLQTEAYNYRSGADVGPYSGDRFERHPAAFQHERGAGAFERV